MALIVCVVSTVVAPSVKGQNSAPEYTNPILFADYSDPDVMRDGDNYYLVASTFHFSPGIPILQSKDLVHWTIVGHVLPKLTMDPRYNLTGMGSYGRGVWAPAIRKHNGKVLRLLPDAGRGDFCHYRGQDYGAVDYSGGGDGGGETGGPVPFLGR